MRSFELDSCVFGQEQIVRSCEYDSELSGVTKFGELLTK